MINDIWNYLSSCSKPIILYGMGNGADKILSVFNRYGIKAAGIFASDDFVRGQIFHDMTVESYSAISQKYDDFIVVVSFASRLDEVIRNVYRIALERELYIPDVPVVFDGELFNSEFYENNKSNINKARMLFSDTESKNVFDDIIEYRISAKIDPLFRHTADRENTVTDILHFSEYTSYVDAGAYVGDTIDELARYSQKLKYVLALEPDKKNFKKLVASAPNVENFIPLNMGAWNREDIISFTTGAGRGSTASRNGSSFVPVTSIDKCLNGRSVDYIKYDVEGAERNALIGSERTIAKYKPDLCVSLYHRAEDIFALPILVNSLNPGYRLYLRRYFCMPAWEIDLYAVSR